MKTVNRRAVVVTPKQPFLDWLNAVERRLGTGEKLTFLDLADCNVYLFVQHEDDDLDRQHLARWKVRIFEAELLGWYQDDALWPDEPLEQLVDDWLDFDEHSMVFDVEPGRLRAEKL